MTYLDRTRDLHKKFGDVFTMAGEVDKGRAEDKAKNQAYYVTLQELEALVRQELLQARQLPRLKK